MIDSIPTAYIFGSVITFFLILLCRLYGLALIRRLNQIRKGDYDKHRPSGFTVLYASVDVRAFMFFLITLIQAIIFYFVQQNTLTMGLFILSVIKYTSIFTGGNDSMRERKSGRVPNWSRRFEHYSKKLDK